MTGASPPLGRVRWSAGVMPTDRPATSALVAAAVAVAALFDVAVRSGVAAASSTVCIVFATLVLLASGRVTNPQAVGIVASAPVFGAFLMIRTSDWLVPLDVLAAAALLVYGASLARGGSAFDLTIPDLVWRGLRAVAHGALAPAFLARGALGERGSGRLAAVVRGVLIGAPIVIALGALLRSADAVFASFVDVDGADLVVHAALISVGLLTFGGLLRLVSSPPVDRSEVEAPRLGAVECGIVLVALNVLLGAFAVARLVALSEGGRRVLESAGLTYAEYARSGFFQLLAVGVLVIGTLLVLRAVADVRTRAQRLTSVGLSLGVVLLTLAVCASAFQRLVLYEAAFGLTMLRLYVQTAIVWVSSVLVLLGIVLLHRSRRAWLAPAAALVALVLLLALNVIDPESFVARHNVAHPPPSRDVDASYLSQLSDDAIDVVAEEYGAGICGVAPRTQGWASFNLARSHADDVRAAICDPRKTGGPP